MDFGFPKPQLLTLKRFISIDSDPVIRPYIDEFGCYLVRN